MTTSYIPTNATGRRIGEAHQRAKLSDREVELIRQLHETGTSSFEIAEKFEITPRHVQRLVSFRQRNQTPDAWRQE